MGFLDKENYFGNDPEGVAGAMIKDLALFTERHALEFRKDKAVLLVIDAQNAYVDEGPSKIPSAPQAVENIKKLILSFPKERVIFSQHLNNANDAGMMSVWWKTLLREGEDGSQLCIDPGSSRVLKKHQYDAFYGTELGGVIKDLGAEQVVICGFSANICCEATGYSAFMRGLEVFIAADATAARSRELHFAALAIAAQAYGMPVLTKDLVS